MFHRIVFILFACSLSCGAGGALSATDAHAQNPHDSALYQAIAAAQSRIIAAARDGNGDTLASISGKSMLEIFLYKKKYNIPDEIAKNPCQRAYEELSASAMFLATFIQPNRQISGLVDKAKDGHEADKWWTSHREALAECERLLKLPQSSFAGPDHLTSIVPR